MPTGKVQPIGRCASWLIHIGKPVLQYSDNEMWRAPVASFRLFLEMASDTMTPNMSRILVAVLSFCWIGCINGRAECSQAEVRQILPHIVQRKHGLANVLQFWAHRMFVHNYCRVNLPLFCKVELCPSTYCLEICP